MFYNIYFNGDLVSTELKREDDNMRVIVHETL